MVTTIQVHEEVIEQLNVLKRQMSARSNEEVIKMLIRDAKSLKESRFGVLPDLETFERPHIDRLG
ncbi:MAG: hypothetical protein SVJ22_02895 [Halobacteriota archaeon]|nr:hypothetical protein [Halobacteriota archaeon]